MMLLLGRDWPSAGGSVVGSRSPHPKQGAVWQARGDEAGGLGEGERLPPPPLLLLTG
jgi:hypothetical protein